MGESRTIATWLNGASLAAASLLAIVGYRDVLGLRDIIINLSASFLFIPVMNLVLLAPTLILDKERERFFGRELAREETNLVFPDFIVAGEATGALARRGRQLLYQRPNPQFKEYSEYRIDVPRIVAKNDIEALLAVLDIFRDSQSCPNNLVDDEVVMRNTGMSFISFGLSSNECTHLYLTEAEAPLFSLVEMGGIPQFVRLANGNEYRSDERRQFGLIVRHQPRRLPSTTAGRRWFLVAGLGPYGTLAAARYLAAQWRRLGREIAPDKDFVVVISTGVYADHIPRLEEILVSP